MEFGRWEFNKSHSLALKISLGSFPPSSYSLELALSTETGDEALDTSIGWSGLKESLSDDVTELPQSGGKSNYCGPIGTGYVFLFFFWCSEDFSQKIKKEINALIIILNASTTCYSGDNQ